MEDQRVFGRVQWVSEERVTPLLVALNRVYNGGGCDGFLLPEANSFPQGAKLARSQGRVIIVLVSVVNLESPEVF
jgi:hypothetical protein